ncbi:biotin transporter BioY, partial [Staphylococcus hominis]
VYAGPSAGFLFLYPEVAFGIGLVRDRYFNNINFAILLVATLVIGVLFLDIVGTIIMGFIINIHASKAFLLSFTFIPGDIIKAII